MRPTPTQTEQEIAELVASGVCLEAIVDLEAGTITYLQCDPPQPLGAPPFTPTGLDVTFAEPIAAGIVAGLAAAGVNGRVTQEAVATAVAAAQPPPTQPPGP